MLCLTPNVPDPWAQDFLSFPYPPQFSQRTQVTLEGRRAESCLLWFSLRIS